MAKHKSQIEKVENVLERYNATPGVTTRAIASLAGLPDQAIGKIVSTINQSRTVYKNWRKVDGKRTLFYRIAD